MSVYSFSQPSYFGLPSILGSLSSSIPNIFGIGMFPVAPYTIQSSSLGASPSVFGNMPSLFPGSFFGGSASSSGNNSANPLRQSLNLIESDPEGARLIQAARARGVYIQVGDPSQQVGSLDVASDCNCPLCQVQQAADGGTQLLGITNTSSNGQSVITVGDAGNIKTIVHELVHSVTPEDQDSREEEGIADVIGTRIAARLGAINPLSAASEQQIFLNKQQFYPNLNQTNTIRQSLAGLGLSVTV